jgi:hypothetical protein
VVAGDYIRGSQRGAHADRDRFLAAVRMGTAEHCFALIKLLKLFFKGSDQNHLAQSFL